MSVGVITGSGTHSLPDLERSSISTVKTRFGPVELTIGRWHDAEVLHVSRHGEGHLRLSSHVNHRANVLALREAGAEVVLGATICGAVDPRLELGELVVFDDLYFPANRLPDGSLCSLHDRPGLRGRGHWIYEGPFSEPLRRALLGGASSAGLRAHDGGCYGHVDGPRFNTRAEIRMLASCGVGAVSQTAGPETVLCGEAGLPYALIGYVTDYANGVMAEATPVAQLTELMARSTAALAGSIAGALALIVPGAIPVTGTHISWS